MIMERGKKVVTEGEEGSDKLREETEGESSN